MFLRYTCTKSRDLCQKSVRRAEYERDREKEESRRARKCGGRKRRPLTPPPPLPLAPVSGPVLNSGRSVKFLLPQVVKARESES